jgi:hypothetical protein
MQPLPEGAIPLSEHAVTAAIGAWAVSILHDKNVAMGQVVGPCTFGATQILARVEVHSWWGADPDRPASPHRGVSLYELPPSEEA